MLLKAVTYWMPAWSKSGRSGYKELYAGWLMWRRAILLQKSEGERVLVLGLVFQGFSVDDGQVFGV